MFGRLAQPTVGINASSHCAVLDERQYGERLKHFYSSSDLRDCFSHSGINLQEAFSASKRARRNAFLLKMQLPFAARSLSFSAFLDTAV